MKRWLLLIGVLLAAVIAWQFLRPEAPLSVSVTTVERGDVELTVSNTRAGSIKACRRSGLSMPIGGRVERLLVNEGDYVTAGQLLLELWNDDRKAQVAQAKSQLAAASHRRQQICAEADNAALEATRKDTLLSRGLTSTEQRDAARTRASMTGFACDAAGNEQETAAAGLMMSEAMLAETRLKAPFAGVVAEITGEVGEFVTPSPPGIPTPPAVDLIDYDCLYVTAPIDEVDAGQVKVGLAARISLDAFRGEFFSGRVSRIAPYVQELEKQARTVAVEVEFEQEADKARLLVGYSADIDIVLNTHTNVVRVPTEVIIGDGQAFRLNSDGLIEQVELATGLRNWNFTEVIEGLHEGDQVVLSLDVEGLASGRTAQVKP